MSMHGMQSWRKSGTRRKSELVLLPRRARLLLAVEWARRILGRCKAGEPYVAVRCAAQAALTGKNARGGNLKRDARSDIAAISTIPPLIVIGGEFEALVAAGVVAKAGGHFIESKKSFARANEVQRRRLLTPLIIRAYDPLENQRQKEILDSKWTWLIETCKNCLGIGLEFKAEWRTTTVMAIARGIVEDGDLDRLPILADALQDAGCDEPALMTHLQTSNEFHTRADWAVWNSLDLGS